MHSVLQEQERYQIFYLHYHSADGLTCRADMMRSRDLPLAVFDFGCNTIVRCLQIKILNPLLPSPTAMAPAATFATEKDVTEAVKRWEARLARMLEADDEEAYLEEEEGLYARMVSEIVFFLFRTT